VRNFCLSQTKVCDIQTVVCDIQKYRLCLFFGGDTRERVSILLPGNRCHTKKKVGTKFPNFHPKKKVGTFWWLVVQAVCAKLLSVTNNSL
jgi:hypothetical protein